MPTKKRKSTTSRRERIPISSIQVVSESSSGGAQYHRHFQELPTIISPRMATDTIGAGSEITAPEENVTAAGDSSHQASAEATTLVASSQPRLRRSARRRPQSRKSRIRDDIHTESGQDRDDHHYDTDNPSRSRSPFKIFREHFVRSISPLGRCHASRKEVKRMLEEEQEYMRSERAALDRMALQNGHENTNGPYLNQVLVQESIGEDLNNLSNVLSNSASIPFIHEDTTDTEDSYLRPSSPRPLGIGQSPFIDRQSRTSENGDGTTTRSFSWNLEDGSGTEAGTISNSGTHPNEDSLETSEAVVTDPNLTESYEHAQAMKRNDISGGDITGKPSSDSTDETKEEEKKEPETADETRLALPPPSPVMANGPSVNPSSKPEPPTKLSSRPPPSPHRNKASPSTESIPFGDYRKLRLDIQPSSEETEIIFGGKLSATNKAHKSSQSSFSSFEYPQYLSQYPSYSYSPAQSDKRSFRSLNASPASKRSLTVFEHAWTSASYFVHETDQAMVHIPSAAGHYLTQNAPPPESTPHNNAISHWQGMRYKLKHPNQANEAPPEDYDDGTIHFLPSVDSGKHSSYSHHAGMGTIVIESQGGIPTGVGRHPVVITQADSYDEHGLPGGSECGSSNRLTTKPGADTDPASPVDPNNSHGSSKVHSRKDAKFVWSKEVPFENSAGHDGGSDPVLLNDPDLVPNFSLDNTTISSEPQHSHHPPQHYSRLSNRKTPTEVTTPGYVARWSEVPHKIFVLLMHPKSKIFEIIQLLYPPSTTTIGDIIDMIALNATEPALAHQVYTGLVRPRSKARPLNDRNSLASRSSIDPTYAQAAAKAGFSAGICPGEILVAIPFDYATKYIIRLGKHILSNPRIKSLLECTDPLRQSKLSDRHSKSKTNSKTPPRGRKEGRSRSHSTTPERHTTPVRKTPPVSRYSHQYDPELHDSTIRALILEDSSSTNTDLSGMRRTSSGHHGRSTPIHDNEATPPVTNQTKAGNSSGKTSGLQPWIHSQDTFFGEIANTPSALSRETPTMVTAEDIQDVPSDEIDNRSPIRDRIDEWEERVRVFPQVPTPDLNSNSNSNLGSSSRSDCNAPEPVLVSSKSWEIADFGPELGQTKSSETSPTEAPSFQSFTVSPDSEQNREYKLPAQLSDLPKPPPGYSHPIYPNFGQARSASLGGTFEENSSIDMSYSSWSHSMDSSRVPRFLATGKPLRSGTVQSQSSSLRSVKRQRHSKFLRNLRRVAGAGLMVMVILYFLDQEGRDASSSSNPIVDIDVPMGVWGLVQASLVMVILIKFQLYLERQGPAEDSKCPFVQNTSLYIDNLRERRQSAMQQAAAATSSATS